MVEIKYLYDYRGNSINEYTIKVGQYRLSVINLGATITKLVVPNENEKYESIHIRYHNYQYYKKNKHYLGSLVDLNHDLDNHNFVVNHYFDCEIIENGLIFTYRHQTQYIKVKFSIVGKLLRIEYDQNLSMRLSHALFLNCSGNLKTDLKHHHLMISHTPFNLEYEINQFYQSVNQLKLCNNLNGIELDFPLDKAGVTINNLQHFDDNMLLNKGTLPKHLLVLQIIIQNQDRIDIQFKH